MNLKITAQLINRYLVIFGIRLKDTKNLKNIFRYIIEARRFKKENGKIDYFLPILNDYGENSGTAQGHYFHQDLLIATRIHERRPTRHIDIGSRVDGFVAHVASFRRIEIMDIRPQRKNEHENIVFVQQDLTSSISNRYSADSISCLHAIEHFGLGRYGDIIDPDGHKKGFANIVDLLEPNGHLYISFPIANTTKIYFNAHRVFSPLEIFSWPKNDELVLVDFNYVNDDGALTKNADPYDRTLDLRYGCGIYTFQKKPGFTFNG